MHNGNFVKYISLELEERNLVFSFRDPPFEKTVVKNQKAIISQFECKDKNI